MKLRLLTTICLMMVLVLTADRGHTAVNETVDAKDDCDRHDPFIEQGQEPPGRWAPDERLGGALTWRGQLGWRTRHGLAIVRWSTGKPSDVENALYPDGSRGEANDTLDHGFRRRASGERLGSTVGSTFGPTTSSSLMASNQSTSHHHRVTFQIWRPISSATARFSRRSRMTASHSRSGPCSTIGVSIRVRIRGRGLAESEAPRPSSRTCVTGAKVTMTTIRGSRVCGAPIPTTVPISSGASDTHRRDFEVAHNPARCAVGRAVCLAWSRRAFGRGGAAGNGRHAALA
jgi:hypothetical protein